MKNKFRSKKPEERGYIMILVVLLLGLLVSIPVAMQLISLSRGETQQQTNVTAQANNVARAGLMDAISWFRKQSAQPVRMTGAITYADGAFNPAESADPETADTIDESIGLVKEYSLSQDNKLWARYEVKRQTDPASGDYDEHAVHDMTEQRVTGGVTGQGLAWYIECKGYVFYRADPDKEYNELPNKVIAASRASTEIRRVSLTLPTNCAVIVNSRATASLTSNSRITGGSTIGFGYFSGASGPTVSGSSVTGTPATASIATASTTQIVSDNIFGVTVNEFKIMADVSVSTPSDISGDYPSMAIVYINGNANFGASKKLRGGGILYVNGNLSVQPDSNMYFSGLIYVNGNCSIRGPANLSGALVVTGSLTMNGTGDAVEVQYDDGILTAVRQQVAQYRENKSTYFNFSGLQ